MSALTSLLSLSACQEDETCEDHVEAVLGCNRVFNTSPCEDPRGTCQVACFAELSCEKFGAYDRGEVPEWLNRCLTKCVDTFTCGDGSRIDATWQCDGAADCADGSDEGERCEYHHCADGQAVRSSAKCNGYAQCGDGSDEADCP